MKRHLRVLGHLAGLVIVVLSAVPAMYGDLLCSGSGNRIPHAIDDFIDTWPSGPLTIPVLNNDYDPDGTALSVVSVGSAGAAGTVAISGDHQAVIFTPNSGYSGASFQYTISDGAAPATATVTIASSAPTVSLSVSCSGGYKCTFVATPSTYANLVDYTFTFVQTACPAGGCGTNKTVNHWRSQSYYEVFTSFGTWQVTARANYVDGFAEATTTIQPASPPVQMDFEEWLPTGAEDDLYLTVKITALTEDYGTNAIYRIYWTDTEYYEIPVNEISGAIGKTASYHYTAPGLKRVRAWVQKKSDGQIGILDKYFDIHNGTPTVTIDAVNDPSPSRPRTVDVSQTTTDDSTVSSWEWDFGDGGRLTADESVPSFLYLYQHPGTYQIRLKVTDNFGASAIASKEVTIANKAPQGQLYMSCNGLDCQFDASGSTDDLQVRSYTWTIDGQQQGASEEGVLLYHFPDYGTHTMSVQVSDGELSSTVRRKMELRPVAAAQNLAFYAIQPCRAYDTVTAQFPVGSPRNVYLGNCIPQDAVAVELNAVVANATEGGNLRLWRPGDAIPITSNLNFRVDPPSRASNSAVAVVDRSMAAQVTTFPTGTGTVRLIVDVVGYYAYPVTHVVATDAVGPLYYTSTSGQVATGSMANVTNNPWTMTDNSGSAVFLTLAMLNPNASGHAKMFAANIAEPPSSVLNFPAGGATSNGAIVRVSSPTQNPNFQLLFKPNATPALTDFEVWRVGAFVTSSAGARYEPIAPCRLLDTRDAAYGFDAVNDAGITVPTGGLCGVPASGARAVRVNVVALAPAADGKLLSYSTPLLYYRSAVNNSTGTVVGVDSGAQDLFFWATSQTGLIVDVVGYYK